MPTSFTAASGTAAPPSPGPLRDEELVPCKNLLICFVQFGRLERHERAAVR
jgi:hypothetical protein